MGNAEAFYTILQVKPGVYSVEISGGRKNAPREFIRLSDEEILQIQQGERGKEILLSKLSDLAKDYYNVDLFLNELKEDFVNLNIQLENTHSTETFEASDGSKVLFRQIREFNPAQHFNQKAFFLVKLPYLKPIYSKEGVKIGEKKTIDFFVVTSDKKCYRLDPYALLDQDYVLDVPDDIPDRWSVESIKKFLTSDIQVDPAAIFDSIREIWDEYVDFEGNVHADVINSLYTILTYCYRLFNAVPYLLLWGEKGTAKTKIGDIHEQLDFNAFKSVAVTGANLYRTIKDTLGTIIVDENEKMSLKEKSENELDIEAIANSGYKVGGKVSRIERVGTRNKRALYPTYSPKVLCNIQNVTETIRDRSYIFIMLKTLDAEKANKNVSPTDPRWQEIRDNLTILVLTHWKEIKAIIDEGVLHSTSINGIEINLKGRDWEKAFPLLILAKFIDNHKGNGEITKAVWEFLADQQNKTIEISIDSFDEVLLDALDGMIKTVIEKKNLEGLSKLSLRDLANVIATREGKDLSGKKLRSYSRMIKEKLAKLGVGRKFRRGTDNLTIFESSPELIDNARKRFNLVKSGETDKDATLINYNTSINFITYINSINSFLDGGINQNYSELMKQNASSIRIVADKLIKLIEVINTKEEEEIKSFQTTIEYLKSKGLTLNEELCEVKEGRELVYVLHPYRPDDLMKEAEFSFVNTSKAGVLYERRIDWKALI
ncbi:MAG: hypothetical protein QW292_11645 [Candidatus Parvarchaeota archaeon]